MGGGTLDENHLPQHRFNVLVWLFILIGIWSFWSGCFKFLDGLFQIAKQPARNQKTIGAPPTTRSTGSQANFTLTSLKMAG